MSILIDNYSESQKNSDTLAIYLNNSYKGQSFGNSGIDIILDSVVFYLKKTSTPTGNMVVQVYELTGASGSEKPTGSVLATSDPYEASDLTTSYQLIPFTFSGSNRITLSANTRYVAIGYFVGDTSSNKVVLGSRTTTPGASGNFSYSADGSSWTANSSFDICFYVYGETIPIIYNDSPPLNLIKKIFNYKVYTNTGQYITTWLDVIEDPSFQTVINGGSVQMQIKLARKTQDFGEELDVAFGNEVQVWCFDTDAPAGIKIFSGYISRYDPSNDGPNEYVSVYCLGYHTVLKDYIHD